MKVNHFENRGGSEIVNIRFRNGCERKKKSNLNTKVVAKMLGKAFWTENGSTIPLYSEGVGEPGRGVRVMDKSIPDR